MRIQFPQFSIFGRYLLQAGLIALLMAGFCLESAAQRFQVVGTITDGETGHPMDRTWVGLYNSERMLTQTWTNFEGRYELPALEEELGLYHLEIRPTKEGYSPQRLSLEVQDWDRVVQPIQLWKGERERVVIAGNILGQDTRQGLQQVWIGLYRGRECVGHTLSDTDGYFLLVGIGKEGNYRVEIRPVNLPYRAHSEVLSIKGGALAKDFYLSPLQPGERAESPDVILSVKGRLVIEGTETSARKAMLWLQQGSRRFANTQSEWDGTFSMEGITARPGAYTLLVEPEEWFLNRTEVPVELTERGLDHLIIEVDSDFPQGVIEASFMGDVASAGGGAALGWVKVTLESHGHRVHQTWTNDLGRYEIIRILVPKGDATLVFQPLYRAFLPVVIPLDIRQNEVFRINPILPTLDLTPVRRVRLQGEIEGQLVGKQGHHRLRLYRHDILIGELQTESGAYRWDLALPEGQYELDISGRYRVFKLLRQPLNIQAAGTIENDYLLQVSRRAALLGAAVLSVGLIAFLLWLAQFKRAQDRSG